MPTASRILCACGEPGICELRELLRLHMGLLGDELHWQSEQAHENFCGVVNCGLLGKASLYMNQLCKYHSTQLKKYFQQNFPNSLLTVHILHFKSHLSLGRL